MNFTVFVIDRYIPNFDKDAGGRCTFMYLNIFNEIGLKVTFLGDDLRKIEPYTTILQQNGIEVLYGEEYIGSNLKQWMKKNLKYYKFIFLQRPLTTIKYINIIKKNFFGKILYFAHDLHYIRLLREYNITYNKKILKDSKLIKKIEMDIFNKVDIIYVVGTFESTLLEGIFKNKVIRNIPLYIYENQIEKIDKNFSLRKDLIFVGGLSHSPNKDGIIWFSKDVFPKIIKKHPNIILHVVSPDITDDIKQLESKNLKFEGYLNDLSLRSLYLSSRIAIAPLRFGAGVKGKVIEAAFYQIPMVTTTIGGEGLDTSIGSFIMEDNADKMSLIINELYNDYVKLKNMSDSGKIFIEKYFSKKKAKDIICKDLK